MSLSDFEEIKPLGKGAFGQVVLVKRKSDNILYAMKKVKIGSMNSKDKENALNEVRVLASMDHPNIVAYKEAFYDDETLTLHMIMEYAEDGDLQSKIKLHKQNKTTLPENLVWSYLIQTLHGLKSLHDKKIMHRDLKSANVFLMKNGTLKLGDLNVSKVVKMGFLYTQTGTPYYASPEVWSEKPYDYKSDIWSVGCVIYELCTTKPPFRGNSLEELFKAVTKGVYDPIPNAYSKDLQQVLALLLQVNPSKRPSCDALLKNPLIAKRIDYEYVTVCSGNLLNTIKIPLKAEDINKILPKLKRYDGTSNDSQIPFLLDNTKLKSTNDLPNLQNLLVGSSSKHGILQTSDKKRTTSKNKSVPPKGDRSEIIGRKAILKENIISTNIKAVSKDKYSDKMINKCEITNSEVKRNKIYINPTPIIDLNKKNGNVKATIGKPRTGSQIVIPK